MAHFFIVVAPGLEELALEELRLKLPLLTDALAPLWPKENSPVALNLERVAVRKGGLEAEIDPGWGWALNLYLKIPTRILERVASFPARDFPKLFQKISRADWSPYFRQGPLSVEVATHGSRLKMKEKIFETCVQALAESATHFPLRKAFLEVPQTLFVRILEDQVTLSVDTSGERLHQRGERPLIGEAPLRESHAAALWQGLMPHLPKDFSVLDPACGAGTLLLEGARYFSASKNRKFAFQNFPKAPGLLPKNFPDLPRRQNLSQLLGIDISQKALEAANENLRSVRAELRKEDSSAAELPRADVVLMNPPWGQRLVATTDIQTWLQKIVKSAQPQLLGLVWGGENPVAVPEGYVSFRLVRTALGGTPIQLHFWKKV